MFKALISIIITLAVALGGVVYLYKRDIKAVAEENATLTAHLYRATEASKRAQERSKRDAKALVAREAEIASQARKLAEAQQGLQKALGAEQEWSNTNVPTDVQNALSRASGGSGDGLRDQ